MKLPIPSFLGSKKRSSDYYLALILTDEKASAVILQAEDGNLKKISTHEEFFTTTVEDLGLEEFITVVDKTISHAEEVLPPNIETHQTVFGVKDKWVETETKKIKKEYLEKLKKVCDALDLSPIGFMVTTEAVTHLMQDEEGAPLSAVFAEIGKKHVTLHLLRGGKIIETVNSLLHESAPATVDKLLSHFTVPVLPARIILFLTKPDESASQTFIKHHWSKSLPFLHMPQVTVLPPGFDRRAVMYGAATQMGFTVVETAHASLPKVEPSEASQEEEPTHKDENLEENEKETAYDNLQPVTETQAGEDFGFVVDQDADGNSPPTHHEKNPETETDHTPVHHTGHMQEHETPKVHHEAAEDRDEKHHGERHDSEASNISKLPSFAFLKNVKIPSMSGVLGGLKGRKSLLKIIIPIVAIILLFIGISLFYIYNVSATVTLTVSPNMVDQEETVVFSTTSPSDFSKKVIAAQNITAAIDGEASTDATGKKDVGEKARGNVTLYNNSEGTVNLNTGAELKASNGQIFVLDRDVRIASASGDIFSGTKPGTSQASVTAKDLGTEGNLPSGTKLAVGSNNTIAAKNDNAFSGGSKKNVTVVSKNDLAKLRADIPKSLRSQAQSKLSELANSNETVLPLVGNATLQKEKFDKKEGDEAKKVTLRATVMFSGISYQNDQLKDYAQTVLKNKYAQDVTFAPNSINATVKTAKQKDTKSAESTVTLQAGLLPKINPQDVIENVKDKSLGQAQETLGNLPQVTKTDITFSPPVPLLPNLFPRLPKQIAVEVKTQ